MNKKLHFSSENNSWETPEDLFQELNKKWGPFSIDVCATKETNKCPSYYGLDIGLDCLTAPWHVNGIPGPKCWMNPPYSKPENPCKKNCEKKKCVKRGFHVDKYIPGQIDFVKKAYEESKKGCLVCCLIPARPDTNIFQNYIWDRKAERPYPWVKSLDFLPYRVKFLVNGVQKDPAPFPSLVVVFQHENKATKKV